MERFSNKKILSKLSQTANVPLPSTQLEEARGKCEMIGCKQKAIATLPQTKFHKPLEACALHFNNFLMMDAFLIDREKVRLYVS